MTSDALFRIASQTKALTRRRDLDARRRGRLSLADRVSRFLPTFERTMVATRLTRTPGWCWCGHVALRCATC
jgi:CubicO group peptidase (beta-lactamase class C family)